MGSPELVATELEERSNLFADPWERFQGYGVMGLPFSSGHVLAYRRMTASSIGPAYSSVWHRDPSGEWTMYVDGDPELSCPRYFGRAMDRVVVGGIEVSWEGPMHLSIRVPEGRIQCGMRMSSDFMTQALRRVLWTVPERIWKWGGVLPAAGHIAGRTLGIGRVALSGRTPNGQRFMMVPRAVFRIEAAAAVLEDRDLGPVGPQEVQARLGDFWIPNGGIFATGAAGFEAAAPRIPGS